MLPAPQPARLQDSPALVLSVRRSCSVVGRAAAVFDDGSVSTLAVAADETSSAFPAAVSYTSLRVQHDDS